MEDAGTFGYDLDGNRTNDGRWAYSWDAENRLVSIVARTSTGPQQRLGFGYDWRGRRISKKVWNNTSGTGSPAVDQLFTYAGQSPIANGRCSRRARIVVLQHPDNGVHCGGVVVWAAA